MTLPSERSEPHHPQRRLEKALEGTVSESRVFESLHDGAVLCGTTSTGLSFLQKVIGLPSSLELIEQALKDGSVLNQRYGSFTPLHTAAWTGRAAEVRLLFEHGADLDAITGSDDERKARKEPERWNVGTAVHLAARAGKPDTLQALLDAGARVDLLDGEGFSPLHRACQHVNTARPSQVWETVDALVRHGHAPNVGRWVASGQHPVRCDRPLHLAAADGDVGLVQRLLTYGADPSLLNERGFTALHIVEQNPRHKDALRTLLLGFEADALRRTLDHQALFATPAPFQADGLPPQGRLRARL